MSLPEDAPLGLNEPALLYCYQVLQNDPDVATADLYDACIAKWPELANLSQRQFRVRYRHTAAGMIERSSDPDPDPGQMELDLDTSADARRLRSG